MVSLPPPASLPVPAHSPVDHRTLPRNRVAIDLPTRSKLRNLYLVQGIGNKEIAEQTGLTVATVQNYVSKHGLTKIRRQNQLRVIERHDARILDEQGEMAEAIASLSAEHALGGLKKAGEAVASNSPYAAKDFQAWTGGVKNLVAVARTVSGQDQAKPDSSTTLNLSMFLVSGAKPQAQVKQVEPIDIPGTPQP